MKIIISLFMMAMVALTACGGGGGGTASGVDAGNTNASTNTNTNTNTNTGVATSAQLTAQIASNLAASYALEKIDVANAVEACMRSAAASGSLQSGSTFSCGTNAKAAAVLSFTNTTLTNIRSIWAINSIDKVAVVALLNSYKATDLNWLNTAPFSPLTLTTSLMNALYPAYEVKINSYYSNLIFQINAL